MNFRKQNIMKMIIFKRGNRKESKAYFARGGTKNDMTRFYLLG